MTGVVTCQPFGSDSGPLVGHLPLGDGPVVGLGVDENGDRGEEENWRQTSSTVVFRRSSLLDG